MDAFRGWMRKEKKPKRWGKMQQSALREMYASPALTPQTFTPPRASSPIDESEPEPSRNRDKMWGTPQEPFAIDLIRNGDPFDYRNFINQNAKKIQEIFDRYATDGQKDICQQSYYNTFVMLDAISDLLAGREQLAKQECDAKLQQLESIYNATIDDIREEIARTKNKMDNVSVNFDIILQDLRTKMSNVTRNAIVAQEAVAAYRLSEEVYCREAHGTIKRFLVALNERLEALFRGTIPETERQFIENASMHNDCEDRIAEVLEERRLEGEEYLLRYEELLAKHDLIRQAVIAMQVFNLEPETAVDECIQRLENKLIEKRGTIDSLIDDLERADIRKQAIEQNVDLTDKKSLALILKKQPSGRESDDSVLSGVDYDEDVPRQREVFRASSPEHPSQFGVSFLGDQTPYDTALQDSPYPLRSRSTAEFSGPSPALGIASETFTVSPAISTSRFGYTDPKVPFRYLNMPPGPAFQAPTPFQQTIVLTSPKREEPLLVNIAVDPKPLEDTERGERFVCDVSLDVQPGYHMLPGRNEGAMLDRRVRSPSPVIRRRRRRYKVIPHNVTPRYDQAPDAITPRTPLTRESMTTPTGIFKRGQFNIRTNLFSREHSPESDESYYWTPQTSPAVIAGPSSRYQLSDSDRSSPSPLIKGRFVDRSWDSSWEQSPSSQEWESTPPS